MNYECKIFVKPEGKKKKKKLVPVSFPKSTKFVFVLQLGTNEFMNSEHVFPAHIIQANVIACT